MPNESAAKFSLDIKKLISFLTEEDGLGNNLCVERKEKEYQVDQTLCTSYRVLIS